MRFLYSSLMYLLSPYLLFRLWWKGRLLPAYRQGIGQRFCMGSMPAGEFDAWIHAVSLGEVIAATPMIEELLVSKRRLLITTMTPTGSQRVQKQFGSRVVQCYIPYELPWALRRFFRACKPRLGIIFETELWPNLIYYAKKAEIPLYLFNARLSEKSLRGYQKIAFLVKPMLNRFECIFAQSQADADRFEVLGAENQRLSVLGNIKFDLQMDAITTNPFTELQQQWGRERVVIILASTHDNEEHQILIHLKKLQESIPQVLVLIAPRHPERFQKVMQLSQELGYNTGLRSQPASIDSKNEVLVIDSLGELMSCFQLSDYAFVGGSLVPVGGHNVLQPIAMQVPVLSGRHIHNFKAIVEDLVKADAIELVDDADDLINRIIFLSRNEQRNKTLIRNASQVLENNKGAVARYVALVESVLSTSLVK